MPRNVSPTLLVLREIRDELKEHRTILHEHSERLSLLERRHVQTEIRLATELTSVTGAVREVRDLLRDRLVEPERVVSLERRVDALERRAGG